MQITIVQGAFLPVPPVAGGAVEKLWFDLGREFARRGLDVTHISRRYPGLPRSARSEGVAYERVAGFDRPGSRPIGMLMDLAYSLRTLFKLRRSDIVVTNTFWLPLILSGLRWFGWRGVIYVSVHRYPQGQMKLYHRVARLQCVSTAVADAVRAQSPNVGRLVKVVPNYLASNMTREDAEASWDARRREVLFVGRVHPEKGIELLIRAFAAIAPQVRADWRLRVVGPHDTPAGGGGEAFLATLKALASTLAVPVDWVGPIYDHAALNRVYREARLFAYPSTAAKGEAFPLAPLEAMGQGCPVVVSDLACFSDYIEPGVNADCFALAAPDVSASLAAALEGLMADEGRARAFCAAGLVTSSHFTLSRVADTFVDDFTALQNA